MSFMFPRLSIGESKEFTLKLESISLDVEPLKQPFGGEMLWAGIHIQILVSG
jgi:hypothetical protein